MGIFQFFSAHSKPSSPFLSFLTASSLGLLQQFHLSIFFPSQKNSLKLYSLWDVMQITHISMIPFSYELFKRQLCFLSACEIAHVSLAIPWLQPTGQDRSKPRVCTNISLCWVACGLFASLSDQKQESCTVLGPAASVSDTC